MVFWKIDDFINTFWLHLTFSKSCQIIALLNVNTAIWQVFELVWKSDWLTRNWTVLTSFSPSCSRGRQRLWWRHNNSLSSLWRKKNFNRHLEAIGGQSAQSITVEASSFNFRWRHWWFKRKILFHQLTVRHFTLFIFHMAYEEKQIFIGCAIFFENKFLQYCHNSFEMAWNLIRLVSWSAKC